MKCWFLLPGLLVGSLGQVWAQETGAPVLAPSTTPATPTAVVPPKVPHHGTAYFSWGYNRDVYTRSDIRFVNTKTDNYDFTFLNAHASDKPDFKDFWRFNSWTEDSASFLSTCSFSRTVDASN